MSQRLIDRLKAGHSSSNYRSLNMSIIRWSAPPALGGFAARRRTWPAPALLNLGWGLHIFEGWLNADDHAQQRRMRDATFKPNWAPDIMRPWNCRQSLRRRDHGARASPADRRVPASGIGRTACGLGAGSAGHAE